MLIVRVRNLIYEGMESIGFKECSFIALRAEAQPLTMLTIFHVEDTAQPLCPNGNSKNDIFL